MKVNYRDVCKAVKEYRSDSRNNSIWLDAEGYVWTSTAAGYMSPSVSVWCVTKMMRDRYLIRCADDVKCRAVYDFAQRILTGEYDV